MIGIFYCLDIDESNVFEPVRSVQNNFSIKIIRSCLHVLSIDGSQYSSLDVLMRNKPSISHAISYIRIIFQ